MTLTGIIAVSGWLLALAQFIFTHLENRKKNDAELLEKTLGYFERGTQARSIGISLVEGIWLKRKKNLDVIVPVLVSQITFLPKDAEDFAQESRNLFRLLFLLEKCLPYASNPANESAEVSDALLSAAVSPGKIKLPKTTLRLWWEKFNDGNSEIFAAEVENSNSSIEAAKRMIPISE